MPHGEISGDLHKEFASFQFPKDHYEVLGVNRNASEEEINNAYKKLLKEGLHEDRIMAMPDGPDKDVANAKLEAAKEAIRVLGNPRMRVAYDAKDLDVNGPKESEIEEWENIAKSRINEAYDFEEMMAAVKEFNSHFEDIMDRRAMGIGTPIIASVAEGDYIIQRMQTIDNGPLAEGLIPLPLSQFQTGETVNVLRSSGEIDNDWQVEKVYLEEGAKGLVRYVKVISKDGTKSKKMSVKRLYEMNPNKR